MHNTTPRLHLIHRGPGLAEAAPAAWDAGFPLAGSVGRPGQLATSVALTLPASTARSALAAARELGVPVRLWLRIAVDAAAQLETLRGVGARSGPELEQWLDRAAQVGRRAAAGMLDAP